MPEPPPLTPAHKLQASRLNEQLKLAASALDRISTVIVAGAIFTPIFQRQAVHTSRLVVWTAVAIILHGIAQSMLYLLKEET